MRTLLKKIFATSPLFVKVFYLEVLEKRNCTIALIKEKKYYPQIKIFKKKDTATKKIKNVLIYHISGMFYAGTEKNLQLIANELVDEYTVFFMYSRDNFSQQQRDQMDPRITCIEFTYSKVENTLPYFIYDMNPHIQKVMEGHDIDLLITSSSGYSHYPFNIIRNIPIILINIFGSPSVQKNIISTIFISKAVQDYSERFTGAKKSNSWAHLPVKTIEFDKKTTGQNTRKRLSIPESAFVFGRIGRKSDAIFDPIGIMAFKEVVTKYPEAHYLIMSPPPILELLVKEKQIPNVHFMSDKENIWDFYAALDALAHFRRDGETFGLNIAEAMHAENPIISHVSHIWNAHLEYLDPGFSRVADKDNVEQYASFMEEFILLRKNNSDVWEEMKETSVNTAKKRFNKETYGNTIKNIIHSLQ